MSAETPRERPILFNDQMVRAILDGRKTVTRRIVKPQPSLPTTHWWPSNGRGPQWMADGPSEATGGTRQTWGWKECPFGKPGDRLWVRETFADIGCRLTYRADLYDGAHCMVKKWIPSIHMPRSASRVLLEITAVRVERLQDISEEQALAEGVRGEPCDHARQACSDIGCWGDTAKGAFGFLWESLNGEGSWAANPWVWVVEFKRVTP
ncbi:TPA: hypothetical protein N2B70_001863 [Pseudomonas aeruginosa]|nr:hypothetical protein [Pseudomonas aeruginosa]